MNKMVHKKGYIMSEETREKIRLAKLGHEVSKKTREKIRLKLLGNKISQETREKLSAALKGKIPKNMNLWIEKGKATRFEKGLIPWNKGKSPSEETRKKIGIWNLGRVLTEEHKRKIGRPQKSKGKTYEEIYGEERGKLMRLDMVGKFKGEKAHNWLGGKSFEPYGLEFNKDLKNKIRQRDNQICMNCGIHREKLKRALTIHHINYDKKCNLKENLIALCNTCHTITNYNREYWTKLFQEKLSKLYNYKYDEKGNIILEVKNVCSS